MTARIMVLQNSEVQAIDIDVAGHPIKTSWVKNSRCILAYGKECDISMYELTCE
jgi:hypothetical protein